MIRRAFIFFTSALSQQIDAETGIALDFNSKWNRASEQWKLTADVLNAGKGHVYPYREMVELDRRIEELRSHPYWQKSKRSNKC